MRLVTPLTVAAALFLVQPALAATVDATATTLIIARPEAVRGASRFTSPLVELVELSARDADSGWADDVRLKLVAWGRWDPFRIERDPLGADLQLLFAEARVLERRLHVRAGRQLVFEGSAPRVVHLDGAAVEATIARGFGVRAYGGAPVVPAFGKRPYDAQLGGRVFWRPRFDTEVGAAYTHGFGEGLTLRQDVGADARWQPRGNVVLNVNGQFSLIARRLVEANVEPRWSVSPTLDVYATARRTAPDLYLLRTSIFTVFTEEERDELGVGAFYEPHPLLGLSADARALWLDAGQGQDLSARATLGLDRRSRTTITGEVKFLRIPANGYVRGRLGVLHRLSEQLALSADGDAYFLDDPINDRLTSYTASGTVSWAFAAGWRAGLSGVAGTTPWFERRLELLGKLTYDFSNFDKARGVVP